MRKNFLIAANGSELIVQVFRGSNGKLSEKGIRQKNRKLEA